MTTLVAIGIVIDPRTVHARPSVEVHEVNVCPDRASLIQLGISKSRDAMTRLLVPAASRTRNSWGRPVSPIADARREDPAAIARRFLGGEVGP